MLQGGGITPVIITGRDSQPLRVRLAALGITHAYFAVDDKRPVAEKTLKELGSSWPEAVAIGDDWPDLPVMQRCAFSCAPANAHQEVKARADFITTSMGGHGAVREFCDLLLLANGHYAGMLQEYTA